jgi:glycosyltransferase involved in cell wall biosynthesis
LTGNVNKKIKILHVIESLGCGGAERVLTYSLKNIDKDKFSVKVVCLLGLLNFKKELEDSGISVTCLGVKNLYGFHRVIPRLCRLMIKEKPDVVHTQLFFANIYGRIASKIAGVRNIVTTLQNPDYTYEDNGKLTYAIRKFMDKYTGKFCNAAFIAASDFVKKDFEKQLNFKGIEVLHNCVDSSIFSEHGDNLANIKKIELGFDKDDIIVLNVGRLHPQKGQMVLIEAFNLVHKNNNKYKLFIVGNGPLESVLKSRVKELNLEKNTIFLKNRQDIPDIMKISDVFVFPSNYEGLPLALIEAMASGLPVIASKIDVLREIVDDGIDGILVENNDCVKLAEAISNLMGNAELMGRLSRNAREKAIKSFNPMAYAKKLENIYQGLVYKNNKKVCA